MRLTPTLLTCLIAGSVISLSACNDNNDSGNPTPAATATTRSITVSPSLGKIIHGRVVLKNAFTLQNIVDAKAIGSNGTATFIVDISKLGQPIIAEVLPAADGKFEYADEALPTKAVSLPVAAADINKAILRAATTVSADTNIGVTALTEAALQQAEKTAGGLTATAINTANAVVKSQLKLNFDITQAPTLVGLNEFDKLVNQSLNSTQRTYAVYLATLAKEAKRLHADSTQPAYDVLKALADDFSDGTFDAKKGTLALGYYNSSFINAWINWVNNFYSQFLGFKTLAAFTSWFAGFNAETPTPPVVTETCASKSLPVTTLSAIADYNGDYKDSGQTVFSLKTATASAVVKNTQAATIKEVCGPNNQSNGTNHVLITDKGNVTLFKTKAGVYSAEGFEFADKTKVFYGEKAAVVTPTLCESNGADDKLGFKNAPNDFCSFSKATSVAITSPDIYTFFNADKKQNVKVTVEGTSVKSVAIEDNNYAWGCGVGTQPVCTGTTFSATATYKQVGFNNTSLAVVFGTTQALTIKNGLLIHLANNTGSTTLNSNACKATSDPMSFDTCQAGVLPDFAAVALKPDSGSTCSISKSGGVITVKAGSRTISATLNGEITDNLHYTNSDTSAITAYSVTVKNGMVNGPYVTVAFFKGKIFQVNALNYKNTTPETSIVCNAL